MTGKNQRRKVEQAIDIYNESELTSLISRGKKKVIDKALTYIDLAFLPHRFKQSQKSENHLVMP